MPPRSGFQRLCIATCIVIFGLIVLGGVVRATDSGLGCPDWPLCHGKLLPQWEKHTLIEYSHRTVASIAGIMMFGIVVMALRSYRQVPAILYPTLAAFVLLLVQAGLGGVAVRNELPAEVVMVHLGTALTILTILMLVTITSFSMSNNLPRFESGPALRGVAIAASAGTLVLMLVGSYVAGAGYGLACSGWPLCNGEVVPGLGNASVQVHFIHRLLAGVVGLTLVALVCLAWHRRPLVFAVAVAALALFGIQALVGAANIWTELADEAGAMHLALASLLWTLLAVFNILIHGLHERLPRSMPQTRHAGLAGETR